MEILDNDYTKQLLDSHVVKLDLPETNISKSSANQKLPKTVKEEPCDTVPVNLGTSEKSNVSGTNNKISTKCVEDFTELQCPGCDYKSTSLEDAFEHFYNILEDRSFLTYRMNSQDHALTPAKFRLKSVLDTNQGSGPNRGGRCPVCRILLKTYGITSLWSHMAEHQGEAHQQAGTCQVCNLEFNVLTDYYEHARGHNRPWKRDLAVKESPQKCPKCEKMLQSSAGMVTIKF